LPTASSGNGNNQPLLLYLLTLSAPLMLSSHHLRSLAPAYYLALLMFFSFLLMLATAGLLQSNRCEDSIYVTGSISVPLYPFLAELTMLQSWLTFRNMPTPCAAFDGVAVVESQFFEYGLNPPDWFVSSLFGCICLHALLGSRLVRSTGGIASALLCTLVSCCVRILLQYVSDVQSRAGESTSNTWFDFGWHWVPAVFPGYMAGICTARLVNHLPADGLVRSWHGWMLFDTVLVAVLLYSFRHRWLWSTAAMSCFPLFCLFCFLCTCKHHGLVLRLLSLPVVAALGSSTYATYLMQFVWITSLGPLHLKGWSPTLSVAIAYVLVGSFLSGAAIHQVVERRCAPPVQRWCAQHACCAV